MAVRQRGKKLYIYFRVNGKLIWLPMDDGLTQIEVEQIEQALLQAIKLESYFWLAPAAKEACIRLFIQQKWEFPKDLGSRPQLPTPMLTLHEAAELFLKDPEIKDHPSRWRYEACILNLEDGLGENRPVKEIRVPNLKLYRTQRLAEGFKPATVNWEMSTLSGIFRVLLENEQVEMNPVRMLRRLSTKSGERQVYLSREDVELVSAECPDWFQDMIWIAYYTGMRRGEIMNLRRHQVNLVKRIITLSPKSTKEGAWKRVPLRHEVLSILEAALKVQAIGCDAVLTVKDRSGVRPVGKEAAKNPWKRALDALGWEQPQPHYHDLRATWKTNARRSGMHSELEMEIMGHETRGRSVHERYGRISDQELLKAVDLMTFSHGDTEVLVVGDFRRKDSKRKLTNQASEAMRKKLKNVADSKKIANLGGSGESAERFLLTNLASVL